MMNLKSQCPHMCVIFAPLQLSSSLHHALRERVNPRGCQEILTRLPQRTFSTPQECIVSFSCTRYCLYFVLHLVLLRLFQVYL